MAFQPHPGMAPPGMAQHNMGPLHNHNAGLQMGQQATQGMPPQMHPGMHGPSGSHGAQAGQMMGGIPQGMNPNAAHAMSHLQPQTQMFNNQQMPQGIPQQQLQVQAQQQQQAALARQQQQQQQIQQQRAFMEHQQRGGMQNNVNPNMMQGPAQGMTPQQMFQLQQVQHQQAQMRQSNMPGNIQFQRQQAHAQAQAQAQALQQANMMSMQGTGGPGPQAPPGPHAQPPQMRTQNSIQSMTQAGQGGPHGDHQQPGAGQLNRPQDQPTGPGQLQQGTPQQGRPPPSSQPQAPQNPMQRVPSSQPGQPPQPPPSQAQQQQQPGPTQVSQPQNPNGQMNPSQLANGVSMEQLRMQEIRRNQFQQSQFAAMQRQAMLQTQQQNAMHSLQNGVVKLMQFADRLSATTTTETSAPDHSTWQRLVDDFFTDEAMFHVQFFDDPSSKAPSRWTIPQPILARYFMAHFASGVRSITLSTGGAEQTELVDGSRSVECSRAAFTYSFADNVQIKSVGPLKALLGPSQKFEQLDFHADRHVEFIPSARIRQLFAAESPNSLTKSPKMSKTPAKLKQQQKQQSKTIMLNESDIPSAPVRDDGVTTGVKMFLENADTVAQMRDLFEFAQDQSQWSGSMALQQFVESNHNGQTAVNMNAAMLANAQAGMSQNANFNAFTQNAGQAAFRSPFQNGAMGMNAFTSPAHASLGLPHGTNSPHMRTGGSPGHPGMMQGAMQPPMAPQMMAQHSGQGTNNSTVSSSNASPNVHGGKKRRASIAKGDGSLDDGMHQVNGVGPIDMGKGKVPPKPAGKRQKANG